MGMFVCVQVQCAKVWLPAFPFYALVASLGTVTIFLFTLPSPVFFLYWHFS
jgi:hypothetical protein